LARIVIQLVII